MNNYYIEILLGSNLLVAIVSYILNRRKNAVDIDAAIQTYYSNTIELLLRDIKNLKIDLKTMNELCESQGEEIKRLRERLKIIEGKEVEYLAQIATTMKERATLLEELSDCRKKNQELAGQLAKIKIK
jgi:chromosome segregation ATPase